MQALAFLKLYNLIYRDNLMSDFCVVVPQEASPPLIARDAQPIFDICTYSYNGQDQLHSTGASKHFSFLTEFWGESFYRLSGLLPSAYPYTKTFMFVMSDILWSVSDFNALFAISQALQIRWFQPSLSHDSTINHQFTKQQPGVFSRQVPFCEALVFAVPSELLHAVHKTGIYSISGWGMDCYLFPKLLTGMSFDSSGYIFDKYSVLHAKLATSWNLRFSNGLTPLEEKSMIYEAVQRL